LSAGNKIWSLVPYSLFDIIDIHSWPCRVFVDKASAKWGFLRADPIGAHFEEPFLAPWWSPWVPYNPVVNAFSLVDATVRSGAIANMAISHKENSMVDLIVGITASEVLFCEDTIVIMIQIIGGLDSNGDWLLLKKISKLSVSPSVIFSISHIFHVAFFL